MALVERLMGLTPTVNGPRIPVHEFQALAAQWSKGNITGAQAQAAVTFVSGQGLNAVTSLPAAVDRFARMQNVDQVLLLASSQCPPFDTAAAVRSALGI
jgi:hypothetical protein